MIPWLQSEREEDMTTFTELIQATGKQLGHEFEIEDDTCAVGSEDVTILLMGITENGEDTLVLTADLGVPPPQRLEKLYEQMMNAMFANQATGGGSFARNADDGHIWLQRTEPIAGITPDMLISRVDRLSEAAEAWKRIIEGFRENAESAGEPQVSGLANGFMQV